MPLLTLLPDPPCCRWCVCAFFSCLSANPSAFGFSPQEAGRPRSPMPLPLPGSRTLSRPPAARATSAIVAVTERNRATTTRRRAGSGEAALRISDTALSSPGGLLMPEKSKRMHGGWWTCTTMRLEERYSRKDEGWELVCWRMGGGWLGGRRHFLRAHPSLWELTPLSDVIPHPHPVIGCSPFFLFLFIQSWPCVI